MKRFHREVTLTISCPRLDRVLPCHTLGRALLDAALFFFLTLAHSSFSPTLRYTQDTLLRRGSLAMQPHQNLPLGPGDPGGFP